MWCCVVALALASPALPGTPPPSPTPLPPAGVDSSRSPSPDAAQPASPSATTTTPSPATSTHSVPAAPTQPPQSSGPGTPNTGDASAPASAPASATPDGEDTPVTPPNTDPTRFHFNGRATIATGIGAGARIDLVSYGDPAGDRTSAGYLVESTGTANMWLRVVGFAERQARRGRPLFFILPDLALSFHLGATRAAANQVAVDNGYTVHRSGNYIGQFGHANFTGGVATAGRFGAFFKGSVGGRYLVGGGPEGAYMIFPFGLGGGLRVGLSPNFTLLVGAKIEAQLGMHGIGGAVPLPDADPADKNPPKYGWSRYTQLAPGGDVVLQARTRRNIYVSWLGTADVTVAGRAHGGQRIFGRSTIDVAIPMTPGLRLSLFGMYSGWRATATSEYSPPFAAPGQTWSNHTFLAGVGVGL